MRQHGMDWPVAVLDYEASSLDPELSYPIEIGIALWRGPASPILVWGSLISPAPSWVRDGIWTDTAQKVHGISPTDLAGAPSPADVLRRANAMLDGTPSVISDNPWWEGFWTERLQSAAGTCATFVVDALRDRLAGLRRSQRETMAAHLEARPRPHRAGDDAARLIGALAEGLGIEPSVKTVEID